MTYLLDNFPFDISAIGDYGEGEVELHQTGVWGGPKTPEIEAARLAGLQASWDGNEARRQIMSDHMKKNRPNMPVARPHQNGISDTHRANMSKAQMGNQNARKKPKV